MIMHFAGLGETGGLRAKGDRGPGVESVARGYGRDGVVAMVLAPGFVATEMAQQAVDDKGAAAVLAGMPLGEMAQPADGAAAVAFLLSGAARHLTSKGNRTRGRTVRGIVMWVDCRLDTMVVFQ